MILVKESFKLYKEPTLLVASILGGLVFLLVLFLNGTFDTRATVDGVTPVRIEMLK